MTREELLERLRATRRQSVDLARPLRAEDYRVQSMPDVSPPWWNLGHTTWFFAKNVLEPHGLYRPEDARLEYVLNSYYEILGPRVDRTERGLQTRPAWLRLIFRRQHRAMPAVPMQDAQVPLFHLLNLDLLFGGQVREQLPMGVLHCLGDALSRFRPDRMQFLLGLVENWLQLSKLFRG